MDQCPLMVLDSLSETKRRLSLDFPLVESIPPGAPAGTSFSDKSVTTQGLPIHNQSFPAPIKTESSEPGLIWQSICGPVFSCFANTPGHIGADGHTPPTGPVSKSSCSNHPKPRNQAEPPSQRKPYQKWCRACTKYIVVTAATRTPANYPSTKCFISMTSWPV
ncbi:hypothetical protein CDEST_13379 [Colletotrichum destructivum]|uniref:Uncharacterized protein n=1 Tax=Colletotrichum destructivum TaxID=34406 RepID=A0AAX4IYS9_9PEZI|nr:hypothetical protein CDEST_13379 [Colletotrichum destructivum]